MRIGFSLLIALLVFSSAASAGQPEDDLVAAIRQDQVALALRIFAENNIDPDFEVPEAENDEPHPGQTVLGLATSLGHWQLVEAMFERKPNPNLLGVAEQSSSTNKREREEEVADIMDGVVPAQIEPNADGFHNNNNAEWDPRARQHSQICASTDDDLARRGAVVRPAFDDGEIVIVVQNQLMVPANNVAANVRVPGEPDHDAPTYNFEFNGPRGLGGYFGGGSGQL